MPARAAETLPPLLLRIGLATALVLPGVWPWAAWPVAILLLLGIATRFAAVTALPLLGHTLLVAPWGTPVPTFAWLVPMLISCRVLGLMGPGPLALDTRWPRAEQAGARMLARAAEYRIYAVFSLRLAVALGLLMGGLALMLQGGLLAQSLGVVWFSVACVIVAGFLTRWGALLAAMLLPLILHFGESPAWVAVGVAALALAFTDNDTLALDAWLARRGGVFPVLRREVVLEPTARVVRGANREKP